MRAGNDAAFYHAGPLMTHVNSLIQLVYVSVLVLKLR